MILNNSLAISHEYIKKVIDKDSVTIDATMGNGNDTLFLSQNSKKVYGFDIQEKAIENTKKLLQKNEVKNVILINDSHSNIDAYVKEPVKCVMFNLGYLPRYNHSISTNHMSTITGIKKSMKLLTKSGLISIVIYHGKDSGFVEKDKVLNFISQIDESQFKVLKFSYENQKNHPPILVLIEKK